VSEQNTDALNVKPRLHQLEFAAYDNEPIWEQAIRAIVETRRELVKRLDRIYAIALKTRGDLRDAEDRLDKIESKLPQ
jgi:hypothetical protein